MNTTVQKFKALLKANKDSDCESILKKCSLDEMRKFARALKVKANSEIKDIFIILLVGDLYVRRVLKADEKIKNMMIF